VRLEIKFRESASPDRREGVIETAKDLCAAELEPLFPGESDAELASLYKAEGVPEERADEVVAKLNSLDEVEFAERAPGRRLIR